MNTEEAYQLHGHHIFNLAYYYLHSREEAEEVTQDVFVKFHLKRNLFRGDAELSTYLYRMTVNQCLDVLRKRKRRQARMKWWPWSSEMALTMEENLTDEERENAMKWKWLLDAIAELPEAQKTAFVLMKVEGKSQKETADIMDISPKAVESLVQRAKSTLIKKSKFFEGL